MNSLGQKIKSLRKARHITQQELCSGLVTASMISQIESDRATPSNHLLSEIAHRLGVEVSYFAADVTVKTDLSQMYRKAKTLMDNERYEEALPLLTMVAFPLAPQFKAESVYNDLASCYARLGKLDDAANLYELVTQAAFEREDIPLAVYTYFNLGHIERRRQRTTVARMYWQRAAKLLVRYPDISMPVALKIYANLGKLYLSEHRYDIALQSYKEASELAIQYSALPDLATIYHGLSCTSVELGLLNQALEYNQKAILAFEKTHNVNGINKCQVNQAIILRHTSHFEKSLEILSTCIRSRNFQTDKPQMINAYAERAYTEIELSLVEKVLEDTKRVIELCGDDTKMKCDMWLLRARAWVINKDFSQGLEELSKCENVLHLNDPSIYAEYNRINRDCLVGLGRETDAFAASLAFASKVLAS